MASEVDLSPPVPLAVVIPTVNTDMVTLVMLTAIRITMGITLLTTIIPQLPSRVARWASPVSQEARLLLTPTTAQTLLTFRAELSKWSQEVQQQVCQATNPLLSALITGTLSWVVAPPTIYRRRPLVPVMILPWALRVAAVAAVPMPAMPIHTAAATAT